MRRRHLALACSVVLACAAAAIFPAGCSIEDRYFVPAEGDGHTEASPPSADEDPYRRRSEGGAPAPPSPAGYVAARAIGRDDAMLVLVNVNGEPWELRTPSNAPIKTLLSRTKRVPAGWTIEMGVLHDEVHALFAGIDQTLYAVRREPNGGWATPQVIMKPAPVGARLATALEGPDQLDVFVVGTDEALRVVPLVHGRGWGEARALSQPHLAPAGTAVAAASITNDTVAVFLFDKESALRLATVTPREARVLPKPLTGRGTAPLGANLAAIPRGSAGADVVFVDGSGVLETYSVEHDGVVTTHASSSTGGAFPGSIVAAFRDGEGPLQALYVGEAGAFEHAVSGSSGWSVRYRSEDRYAAAGASVASLVRAPGKIEAFVVSARGLDVWRPAVGDGWMRTAIGF